MATIETNVNIFAEEALAKNVVSLLADMPFGHFSQELVEWIRSTCLHWHKKELLWSEMFIQWQSTHRNRELC
jgi:hypothetical protein